ncbi:hypothetical protein AY599_05890 [Leptolyngbya valderiana BDU 20041]|nr:hypothetical protein AY599_05890 [Leptolyngbya valderiana BDU 20041]
MLDLEREPPPRDACAASPFGFGLGLEGRILDETTLRTNCRQDGPACPQRWQSFYRSRTKGSPAGCDCLIREPDLDGDGDGDLTVFDFLAFQNAFDAGFP